MKVGDLVWTNYRSRWERVRLTESRQATDNPEHTLYRTDPVLRGPDRSNPHDVWPPFLSEGWFKEINE